jgi:uncharacterized protein (DUF849 family)
MTRLDGERQSADPNRRPLLQAAINGARKPEEHAALPCTPAEQAEATAACRREGAEAVHAHVRDGHGHETLSADAVDELMRSIRSAAPGLPVGVSTGAWIVPDPAARLARVRGWRALPDFASVNFDEAGAADLAAALLEMGVGVEAGLASPAAAEQFVDSRLASGCLRVLLEPQDGALPAALEAVASIEQVLDGAGVSVPRLLHGTGVTAWPLLAVAVRRGYQARIGLEDTLLLPDGRVAPDNAALVAAARGINRPPLRPRP